MNVLRIWMMGGITGFLTGLFFISAHNLLTQDNLFEAWEFGLATATPCLSAIIVSKYMGYRRAITLAVAYLTFIVPLLGSVFGASGTENFLIFPGLGFAGGLIWSTPLALWNLFHNGKTINTLGQDQTRRDYDKLSSDKAN